MAKGMHRLSARTVATAKAGRHSDGGGLYLVVTPTGARQWAFIIWRDRKPQEVGLGSIAQGVSLALARERAGECRRLVAEGRSPGDWKRPTGAVPTFGEVAAEFIAAHEGSWRNEKHRAQWRSTLATYAQPINDKPVNEIGTDDVLAILQPIWKEKNETASRLRGRIEKVLDAAKAKKYRFGENPALWRGHLSLLLGKGTKLQRGHHAALARQELPGFITRLREKKAVAALALEFTILTAARSGETLGARWAEIDIDAKLWTVPANRMKSAREHRVPLSARACAILNIMRQARTGEFVFPSQRGDKPLSGMAMEMLLRRMGADVVTVHGFRSTFRDWCGEAMHCPREVAEAAAGAFGRGCHREGLPARRCPRKTQKPYGSMGGLLRAARRQRGAAEPPRLTLKLLGKRIRIGPLMSWE